MSIWLQLPLIAVGVWLLMAGLSVAMGRHGPCRTCGRKWLFGWTATNLMEVCSWGCADRLPLRPGSNQDDAPAKERHDA